MADVTLIIVVEVTADIPRVLLVAYLFGLLFSSLLCITVRSLHCKHHYYLHTILVIFITLPFDAFLCFRTWTPVCSRILLIPYQFYC